MRPLRRPTSWQPWMPAYWQPGPYYLLQGRRTVDSRPAPLRNAIQLPGVPPGCHWVAPPVESTTAHAARPLPITPYIPGLSPRTQARPIVHTAPFYVVSCLNRTTQEAPYARQPPTHRRPLHPYHQYRNISPTRTRVQ